MAEPISIQQLKDASEDAKTLEKVINGDENVVVTTRLGETYPSVKGSLKKLFENGGLPAAPFANKVAMEGSDLVDGDYAYVTDDTTNNGLYVKTAGAWVKSDYDPLAQAKTYTDSYLKSITAKETRQVVDLNNSSYTKLNKKIHPIQGGHLWLDKADSEIVIIPVVGGEVLSLVSRNQNILPNVLCFYKSSTVNMDNNKLLGKDTSVVVLDQKKKTHTLSVPAWADRMAVGLVLEGYRIAPEAMYKVDSVLLSTSDVLKTLPESGSSLPISGDVAIGLQNKIDTINDVITISDVEDVAYGSGTLYIDNFYVRNEPTSPTGLSWRYEAGDIIAVIPTGSKRYVKVKSNNVHSAILNFTDEVPTPENLAPIPRVGVHVIAANKDSIIEIPKGTKYLCVSIIAAGIVAKPSILKLLKNKVVSTDDVLDYLPASGSLLPVSANVIKDLQTQIGGSTSSRLPSAIPVGAKTSVFATHKNFILKDDLVDGVSNIFVSRDLGVTWTNFVNTIGKITNFHFFVDGSIMLCGTGKVYTLNSDYTGLIESTVLDHDGSVFVPENHDYDHHFYSLIYGNQTQYVDGVEIFFWGEYRFNGAIRMWYTADRGRTIKCAVKFGTTVMDGAVQNIRHIHMVTQRRQDEKFYFSTGDHGVDGAENMLITGKYNVTEDTWDWKVLASGWRYKFGDIFFDDYYAYLLTDFTSDGDRHLTGFYRVAVENLNDFNKYHPLYKPVFADLGLGTFSRYIEDSNGNKIIFPDNAGHGKLWIATGDMDFEYHTTTPLTSFMNRLGVNDLGDIYSNDPFADPEATGYPSQKLYINHGSHNLTKILRSAGLTNFMKHRVLLSDTWVR